MVTVYILELNNNKYYVGKTNNLENRLNKHKNNTGCWWTKKYGFKAVYKIYYDCDDYDEDKYTIMMMNKYGLDNVRGGSFTQKDLDYKHVSTINKMINSANDTCFQCNFDGHSSYKCPYLQTSNVFLNTRNKIIDYCNEISNRYVHLDLFVEILEMVDDKLFHDIDEEQVQKIAKHINKQNYANVKVHIIDNKINYKNFAIGLTYILDNL